MVDYSTVVEQVVDQLFERFRAAPSLFFTESDLVCEFYRSFLSQFPDPCVKDADGKEHLVIHTEYPTPFRCDMSKLGFKTKGDEDRKDRQGKYKRGHIDLVILNPEMIKELRTDEVMMQNYARTKASVVSKLCPGKPMLLHAIEFQYTRGKLTKEGAKRFVDVIKQDHDKLAACCHHKVENGCEGFIESIMSLVFLQTDSLASCIEQGTQRIEGIRLCIP